MPGFDPEHLDATVVDLERLAGQRDETPSWLTGLIAKHGQPTTTRKDNGTRQWNWGEERGVEIFWSRTSGSVDAWQPDRMASVALRSEPTDADISAVVALAGLCDAPDRWTLTDHGRQPIEGGA